MSTQELGMDHPQMDREQAQEPERIVEFEFQFPTLGRVPKIDIEPLRQTAERAVLLGIGAGVLVARGVAHAARSAMRAGEEAAEQPGPITRALLRLVGRPPKTPAEQPTAIRVPVLPISDYDGLTASEIIARLSDLTHEQLQVVRAYEARTQARESVLTAIDQHLAG